MRDEEFIKIEEGIGQLARDSRRKTFYHLAARGNLGSILRRGLIPSGSEGSRYGLGEASFEDIEGKVFLGRTKGECYDQIRINRRIGLPVPGKADRVLLKVTLPEGCEVESDDSGFLYVERVIPPENIKVIG